MRALAAAGIVGLFAATAGAVATGDLRSAPVACAVWFGVALLSSWAAMRGARAAPRVVLAGLVAVRVVALLGGPTLSDDENRYVHEGRAQRLGFAVPYAVAPKDLQPPPPPDDGTSAHVNHPDVPAAYPPGVELVLWAAVAAGDLVGHARLPLRLLLAASDAWILVALWRRRKRGRELGWAWVAYGAHPVPILEIALGGHLDGLGVAALFTAAAAVRRPSAVKASVRMYAGALLALAMHVKPIAVVALPAFLVDKSKRAALIAGFAVALAIPAGPYLLDHAPLTRGLVEYGTRWRAMPFAYALVEAPLTPIFDERAARNEYTNIDAPFLPRPILVDAGLIARAICGVVLMIALAFIARTKTSLANKIAWSLAAAWLLAPTVHPWYLDWIVPFAALSSSRALLAFTAMSPLLYQPVFGATWQESAWPRLVMLAALAIGFAFDLRHRGDRDEAGAGEPQEHARDDVTAHHEDHGAGDLDRAEGELDGAHDRVTPPGH